MARRSLPWVPFSDSDNVIRPSRMLVISRPRVGVPDSYESLLSRIEVAIHVPTGTWIASSQRKFSPAFPVFDRTRGWEPHQRTDLYRAQSASPSIRDGRKPPRGGARHSRPLAGVGG